MTYPQYPEYPEPAPANVKPVGFNGKLPPAELAQLILEYRAIGLYALPKKTGAKIAHWRFWMKRDGNVPLETTDANLKRFLPDAGIDGIILHTGLSCAGRLAVVDIDPAGNHAEGQATYNAVQQLSPTNFVFATAGNGLHLYYILPADVPALKPSSKVHWSNLDIRAKNALAVLPGSYQQYVGEAAAHKGVADGHVGYYRHIPGGDYTQIPTMSVELYNLLWDAQNPVKPELLGTEGVGAHNYEHTAEALARIEAHLKKPLEDREKLVIECLGWVLPTWKGKTYDQWLQMWMAAHHGSSGSTRVRDYIASHQTVWNGRPASEVSSFRSTWDAHQPSPDGYTVASLMYLARQEGWLQTTGLELPDSIVTNVDVQYIQDWTKAQEVLPRRVLVKSQTGSGKTYNIRYIWDKLNQPKAVIFVPTTKLAIELANTLKNEHKMPVTLYIDQKKGRTLDADDLVKAQVLVTTLQTFGNKVHKEVPMSKYGLVYFEESDQLFQQFARGGGNNIYSSHVKDTEARAGFAVIHDAFAHSDYVWCVDATMTQVTYYVAKAYTPDDVPVTVIQNTRIAQKSAVQMLTDKGETYQVVLSSLLAGKKTVVVADTAQSAEEVVKTMAALGVLEGKKALLITSHTERNREVHAFMEDVNAGAKEYDLLAYNSVMASGVSITSVKPDTVVQIATYLTPRVNLQLLNRYRQQGEVYVYFQQGESLYLEGDKEILLEAYRRAGLEAELMNMPLVERTQDARVREVVASYSIGDETLQRRAAAEFYASLLVDDGREVKWADPMATSDMIAHSLKAVRALKKEQKDELRHSWIETRPINRDDPADPDMSDLEVAQGEIHAKIDAVLRGNIPTDTDPATIYDVVHEFSGTAAQLSAFILQGDALKQAETYLADDGRAITTLANHITLIQVLTTVHLLYPSLKDVLTNAELEQRAPAFMEVLRSQREQYDAVINRSSQKFDVVHSRTDNDIDRAVDFAKIILAKIGLKQRTSKAGRKGDDVGYKYEIENADNALRFLNWRYPDREVNIEFTDAPIRSIIAARGSHIKIFQAMTGEQQAQVMHMMNSERSTDFPTAVEAVLMGDRL